MSTAAPSPAPALTPADAIVSSHYTLYPGHLPLLVSVPHAGTELPAEIARRMVPRAHEVENTDWHLDRVYDFVRAMGASLLVPRMSRFVVDLNRPPDDTPMYPGVNNTGLCPVRFFSGDPIYRPGEEPDAAEIAERVERHWRPYHQALEGELARLHAAHGRALLWEGHSIASRLPWLFEGRLPDLNLGTVEGRSCAPAVREALAQMLAGQTRYTQVVDGRFKGGYITRRHGRPEAGVHAVQMEMVFACYLRDEAPPWTLDTPRVEAELQPLLARMMRAMIDAVPDPR